MDRIAAVELSDKELYLIGRIIASWGMLEHEIFTQLIMSFDSSDKELPKEMNNLQFTGVLDLWKEHVIANATGERKEVLEKQYELIVHYQEYRNALIHGMWSWSTAEPDKITSTRVRKKQIISVVFTADDLAHMDLELGKINFKVRYPGGLEDLAKERANLSGQVSRRWVAMVTDHPIAKDFLPNALAEREKSDPDTES